MQNIIIDEEFRMLLPALDAETFRLLEENIIENGCRDALVLWGETLIDGHNRYSICTKHDIPFRTVNKDFGTREEALIWIISTQVSRRNLTPIQLSHFRGLHYRADKKIQGTSNQYTRQSEKSQNATFQKSTASLLANQYNVSRDTIIRDSKVSKAIDAIGEASPEAKRMILAGEVTMKKKDLSTLASMMSEDIDIIAAQIEEGAYSKKDLAPQAPTKPQTPLESALAGVQPLTVAIGKVTALIQNALPDIRKKADKTKLQATLRLCIDTLEELYSSI